MKSAQEAAREWLINAIGIDLTPDVKSLTALLTTREAEDKRTIAELRAEVERLTDLCQRNSDDLAFLDQCRAALAEERQRADRWMARVHDADCEGIKHQERAEKAEAALVESQKRIALVKRCCPDCCEHCYDTAIETAEIHAGEYQRGRSEALAESQAKSLKMAERLARLVRQAWERNDDLAMRLFGSNTTLMLASDAERALAESEGLEEALASCVDMNRIREHTADLLAETRAEVDGLKERLRIAAQDRADARLRASLALAEIEGLTAERDHYRVALAVQQKRVKELEKALAEWRGSESLPDCAACAVLDAALAAGNEETRPVLPLEEKYHELLYAVGRKWPNESRHQTALRYIREAEMQDGQPASAHKAPENEEGK